MAWKVTLPEIPHAAALYELRDALALALVGQEGDGEVWLGAHSPDAPDPPPEAVIFQTEAYEAPCMDPVGLYAHRLARASAVWDYSAVNMAGYLTRRKVHVPLGRSPAFETIKRRSDPPHDIGFFGSVNERRARALPGETTRLGFGVYGAERDRFAGACKAVVVPHYYPNAPAEQVRIIPLAAAGICVLAEYAPDFAGVPGCFVAHHSLAEAARAAISTGCWEQVGILCQAEYDDLPAFDQIVRRAIQCTNQ